MKSNKSNDAIGLGVSTIESDMELLGDLTFSHELHVKGRINGNIVSALDSDGKLVLHEGSVISGEVRAPYIYVEGQVVGNLFASKRLSLGAHSLVQGDVHYSELEMEKGASVNGTLVALGASDSE